MNGGEPTRISIIFSFKRERPHRRVGCCKLRRVMAGDAKDCYAKEPGIDLFEQLHLFPAPTPGDPGGRDSMRSR